MAAAIPLVAGIAGQAVATSMATAAGMIAGTAAYSAISSVGFMVGSAIGSIMMAPEIQAKQGPRATDNKVQTSTYGAPLMVPYGRVKIAGNFIWDYGICEKKTTEEVGGKGGDGGGAEITTYTYYDSWAIGFCEGEVTEVHKIWFDADLVYDKATNTINEAIKDKFDIYYGDEDQQPDPLMEAVIGFENVPAYRGVCYIVFDNVLLTDWGSRIPNVTVELSRFIPATAALSKVYPIDEIEYLDSDAELVGLRTYQSLVNYGPDLVNQTLELVYGSLVPVVAYQAYSCGETVSQNMEVLYGSLVPVVDYVAFESSDQMTQTLELLYGSLVPAVDYISYTIPAENISQDLELISGYLGV